MTILMGSGNTEGPKRSSLRRFLAVLVSAAAPVLVASLSLVDFRAETADRLRAHRVALAAQVVRGKAEATADDLRVLAALLPTWTELDWRGFESLARFGLLDHSKVLWTAWTPFVPEGARRDYEAWVERSAYRSFRIGEQDEDGQLRNASPRDEYFPMHFAAPAEAAPLPLGLDIASIDDARGAIDRARDQGEAMVVLAGVQPGSGAAATELVILPVYRSTVPSPSAETRHSALEGMLVAAVRLPEGFGAALDEQDLRALRARLAAPLRSPARALSAMSEPRR